ncbi:MAG: hypothetical protein ACP5D2_04660, partial [Candidatus Nanoarchaeia archaeon]
QFILYLNKVRLLVAGGLLLLLLSLFYVLFLIPGIFILLFCLLFAFAKSVEKVMVRQLLASKLREGDWLVEDVKIGEDRIKKAWEGLSLDDIKQLKKAKKKVKIQEGIPFVPSFLIAFLIFEFFKEAIMEFLVLI